jgi:UDP-glucose 4-epimerase
MAKKVLITGGAGYIGSICCSHFRRLGYETLVFDNLCSGAESQIRGDHKIGDIREQEDLDQVFQEHEIDAVMHFAALIHPGQSLEQPDEYYDVNYVGTLKIVEAMHRHGVEKMVFSSSASVYGDSSGPLLKEDQNCSPTTPYGNSKLMSEQLLEILRRDWLKVTCLRYFNAAGASPEEGLGEAHVPETHLIPLAVSTALGRREKLSVFGRDYATEDGTCIRDYVHVKDIARAHISALERLQQGHSGSSYNIASGVGSSVREVVLEIEKQLERHITVDYAERRAGDPHTLVANIAKSKKELGWEPSQSSLAEIVSSTIQWVETKPQ